ncbi:uncharacterized protein T551_01920 [Pneumocystis jirovecii RU7]|uniref:Uncharacterized protein n=1 Tax=Pneumocystis jirovecii (strain RU7) TaxID=1408657 RepID=A0A0W4ZNL6_PNEJ7|nr:uncharacterized protein T551_01920 [Pneumocystis jirovecii RU7]KTW29976.1 hypothetical protein T551_01920 [Pneumocystis jirovecii RU7]
MKTNKNIQEISKNSIIKSQIDISFNEIKKLVASWLEPKESIFEEKETSSGEEHNIFETKRQGKLGLGANAEEIKQRVQISKAEMLLKRKLINTKKRKQWEDKKESKILNEDNENSDDFDSKNIYVKKLSISGHSKSHPYYVIGENKKENRTVSFFDVYKNEKRKKKRYQNDFYPESLHYEIFHELAPKIAPILRGSIKYNFKEKTAIYHSQSSIYEIETLGNNIEEGFYRVGVFDSEKKFRNGFIQWDQLKNLLKLNISIHEEISLYLDDFNNVWHVDYVLNILNKKVYTRKNLIKLIEYRKIKKERLIRV